MKTYHRSGIFLFIFLFSLFTFSSSVAQENLPEIVKRIEPSTVVILTYDSEGKALAQGSGFFVDKNGDIITNEHVLQGASQADVKISNGKVYRVTRVVAEDIQNDIIKISADIPNTFVRPLPVSSSIPNAGERIIVIGSPLGLETTVSDSIVSAVRELPGFEKIIQITAVVSPGSSGSPVVNMKGAVIGVVVSQMVEGQNLNFAIPGEKVAKLSPAAGKSFAEGQAHFLYLSHPIEQAPCLKRHLSMTLMPIGRKKAHIGQLTAFRGICRNIAMF